MRLQPSQEVTFRIYFLIWNRHCKPCCGEKGCTNCHVSRLKEKPVKEGVDSPPDFK